MSYPIPENELQRLQALRDLQILDSAPEPDFDALVLLACELFAVPISLISLIDEDRQWFKAVVGLDVDQTEREAAFCNYTINSEKPFVVTDASRDERFHDNRLVTGEPGIRFYAGVPISIEPGINLGSFCIIDQRPRQMDSEELLRLQLFGKIAESLLCQHKTVRRLSDMSARFRDLNLQLDTALTHMSQGISMFDADQRLILSNERFREIYKLTPELVRPGAAFCEILKFTQANGTSFDEYSEDHGAISPDKVLHEEYRLADGRFISVRRHPVTGGGWVTTHEDVTERASNEENIAFMASHDLLTELPNRALFKQKLDDAGALLLRDGRRAEFFSVLMLDLDKFKNVNDTLGHPVGDELLKQVAKRLKSSLRETDVVARLGGDEFAILQTCEGNQREAAIALALRIDQLLSQPFDLDGNTVNIETSIGIAMAPENGVLPDDLMKKADMALYRAKADGRGCFSFFSAELMKEAEARRSMELEMREGLKRNEFELHYQPVVDVKTRQICGLEALVRWRHPTRGLVNPIQFIPLAEETGLIVPLGEWILQKACADGAELPEHIKIAVNLSAVQFRKGNLFDVILLCLVESGLNPARLELEITETVLMENAEECLTTIRQLKNLGISLALDDFGTGYSSLNYVTKFPFDKIKIDRSFTQGFGVRDSCGAVIASVQALGRGLGMRTIAEGVETEQQFEALREAGIDLVQGYLFGRPVLPAYLDLSSSASTEDMEKRAAS